MLNSLDHSTMDELVSASIPDQLRFKKELLSFTASTIPNEYEMSRQLKSISLKNKVFRSYLGQGFYGNVCPPVIQRKVLENPAWYTSYTAYQSEVSQGRLESFFNFQTVISELTGLPACNSSLLDEATACAEAMMICYSPFLAIERSLLANYNYKVDKILSLKQLSSDVCSIPYPKIDKKYFFVDAKMFSQNTALLRSRSYPFPNLELFFINDLANFEFFDKDNINLTKNACGIIYQPVGIHGELLDLVKVSERLSRVKTEVPEFKVCMAVDLMHLSVIKSPGELSADIAVGSTQRFGTAMGFGGPSAAFMATQSKYIREMPGRIVGQTIDAHGNKAYRLAIQTREQHIKRERSSSNLCTSQSLLANICAFYAIYHGAVGLQNIALTIHKRARQLANEVIKAGHLLQYTSFIDTICIQLMNNISADSMIAYAASRHEINIRKVDATTVSITIDETVSEQDCLDLIDIIRHKGDMLQDKIDPQKTISNILFAVKDAVLNKESFFYLPETNITAMPQSTQPMSSIMESFNNNNNNNITVTSPICESNLRTTGYLLNDKIFSKHRTETELLRYIHHLESKDISLCHSMIPLGSCTMKLNAASQMAPISWPEFSQLHPHSPEYQSLGYNEIFEDLKSQLCEISGYDGCSLQPNSGAQGEYAGLRAIQAYHHSRNDFQRDVCLIPISAHGTNPATARMCNMTIVNTKTDQYGNTDIDHLTVQLSKYKDRISAIMLTYPNTYGVFDDNVTEVCRLIHSSGGMVYMDGANLNSCVGLVRFGDLGADVSHFNLHKTFAIAHGGGGPGMGPIAVKAHLIPFLPSCPLTSNYLNSSSMAYEGHKRYPLSVSGTNYGSASILTIPWAYMRLLGPQGLKEASQLAILNANYMAALLKKDYKILYQNNHARNAHEFIIDLRTFKKSVGIDATDVCKRLQDYGFHAPTLSWPVSGTIMLEPTESESKEEMDRYVAALLSIRQEIRKVETGEWDKLDNPLKNSPHTLQYVTKTHWPHNYTREEAVYPLPYLREKKFWVPVGRVNDIAGDINLILKRE